MNKTNVLKVEILKVVIDKYLWSGVGKNEDHRSTPLCFCVRRATKEVVTRDNISLTFAVAAENALCQDIKTAIGGYTYAENYLVLARGWSEHTPKEEFQQWRKELAERLIEQYEEEAE